MVRNRSLNTLSRPSENPEIRVANTTSYVDMDIPQALLISGNRSPLPSPNNNQLQELLSNVQRLGNLIISENDGSQVNPDTNI
jgi:hypothetical protein